MVCEICECFGHLKDLCGKGNNVEANENQTFPNDNSNSGFCGNNNYMVQSLLANKNGSCLNKSK